MGAVKEIAWTDWVFGDKHWNEPLKWARKAEREGVRKRVFCASMADVFENRFDSRARLWTLIEETPQLDWLLLTNRPEQMNRLAPLRWAKGWPRNVWAGTTVEDQARATLRIERLAHVPARIRFLSCEPLLGPVDLTDFFARRLVEWVIVGGESGPGARPMHPDWARTIRDRCIESGIPFFLKQWGKWAPGGDGVTYGRWVHPEKGGTYGAPMVGGELMTQLGKKAAGRLLDGRTWDEMPA